MALWLFLVTATHAVGLFVFRLYRVTDRIEAWLHRQSFYRTWQWPDRALGAGVGVAIVLGLTWYMYVIFEVPELGPIIAPIGDVGGKIGGSASGFLGVAEPDFSSRISDKAPGLWPDGSEAAVIACINDVGSNYPFWWAGWLFLLLTAPLALVLSFEPLFYAWHTYDEVLTYRLRALRRRSNSCGKCFDVGVVLRNPFLFGNPCRRCRKLDEPPWGESRLRLLFERLMASYFVFMGGTIAFFIVVAIATIILAPTA